MKVVGGSAAAQVAAVEAAVGVTAVEVVSESAVEGVAAMVS